MNYDEENEGAGVFSYAGHASEVIRQCLVVFFVALVNWGMYVSFCQAYSYPVMGTNLIVIFFSSVIFGIIFSLSYGKRLIWCTAVFALFIMHILSSYDDIIGQADGIFLYIRNRASMYYNNSSSYLQNIVELRDDLSGQALTCALLFISIALMMASVMRGTRFVTVILVMAVLFINMMYGRTLNVSTSLYIFVSVIVLCGIAQANDRKDGWKHGGMCTYSFMPVIILTAIMLVSFFMGIVTYTSFGERILSQHEKFWKIQHDAEQKVQEAATGLMGKLERYTDKNRLNNNPPYQTGKKIMTVRASRLPENNIYLRECSSDTYADNTWSSQVDYSMADDGALKLFSENYNVIDDIAMMKLDSDGLIITSEERLYLQSFMLELDYKLDNSDLIFPYWADIESAAGEASADGVIRAAGNDRKLLGSGQRFSFSVYDVGEWIERKLLDQNEARLSTSRLRDDYAIHAKRNYSGYPDSLSELAEYAGNIKSVDEMYSQSPVRYGRQCGYIRAGIWNDASYSRMLKRLPDGADFVENFLFSQKEGYCVHYATAGTLLCRMKNIPARYVTGYRVEPSMFREVKDRDGNIFYMADVPDTAGHAWTEVYKPYLGWVPVEMTEGEDDSDKTYDAFVDDYSPSEYNEDDNTGDIPEDSDITGADEDDSDDGGAAGDDNEEDTDDGGDENDEETVLDEEEASVNYETQGGVSGEGTGAGVTAADNTVRNTIIFAVSLAVILIAAVFIVRRVLLYRKIRAQKEYESLDRSKKLTVKAGRVGQMCAKSEKIKYKRLDDSGILEMFMSVGKGYVTKEEIEKLGSILERSAFAEHEIDEKMFGEADAILDKIKSFTKQRD